jgi:hypothetical protein
MKALNPWRPLFVASLLVCHSHFNLLSAQESMHPPTRAQNAWLIVSELNRCPCWMNIRQGETDFRAGITKLYLRLAQNDTETIRAAIQQYISTYGFPKADGLSADAKVFTFLRVVFAVPTGYINGVHVYGSWRNPIRDNGVDLLWPYAEDAKGNLVLDGVYAGEYLGPPYDALADFDQLLKKFGRRNTK